MNLTPSTYRRQMEKDKNTGLQCVQNIEARYFIIVGSVLF